MDLGDCYRLLGLRSGASFAEIKASYRRLVQQYHPDLHPDDTKAKDKFIALTEAYKLLQAAVPPQETAPDASQLPISGLHQTQVKTQVKTQGTAAKTTVKSQPPNLAEIEQRLKWKTYEQLQRYLQGKRFPQAIALVEALAARLPSDAEVRQWQAIVYQIWGRTLISENQPLKAKIYLKKALKTDPHNKTLWHEVQRDFQRLEQIY